MISSAGRQAGRQVGRQAGRQASPRVPHLGETIEDAAERQRVKEARRRTQHGPEGGGGDRVGRPQREEAPDRDLRNSEGMGWG